MEEVKDQKEFNHVCKLCYKRFPSGKSLGGHMRSHVMAEARKNKLISVNKVSNFVDYDDGDEQDEDGGNFSKYGLRENPKKTWRMVNSNSKKNNNNYQGKLLCKKCGKGFHSLKALCGHMSIHSEKDKNFDYDDEDYEVSWSSESNSDVDVGVISSSSGGTEFDQLELEEVAICLMMLSRDSSDGRIKNFVTESSDINSVIKSNADDQEMDNSDSGYFENNAKELESDDSIDGFNYKSFESKSDDHNAFKKKKFRDYSEITSKYECRVCNKVFQTHQALGGHIISHRKDGENVKSLKSYKKIGTSSPTKKGNVTKNKVKVYECPYCSRTFKSGQAFGGHKRSHMIGSNNVVLHSEEKSSHVPVLGRGPEIEVKQPLIDLNLPAPAEDEDYY